MEMGTIYHAILLFDKVVTGFCHQEKDKKGSKVSRAKMPIPQSLYFYGEILAPDKV